MGNPVFGTWNRDNADTPYRSGHGKARIRTEHRCPVCRSTFLSIYPLHACGDHVDMEESCSPCMTLTFLVKDE